MSRETTVKLRLRTEKGGYLKDEVDPNSDYQLQKTLKNMLLKAGGYQMITAEWEEDGCICTFSMKRKEGKSAKVRENVSRSGYYEGLQDFTKPTGAGQKGTEYARITGTGKDCVSEHTQEPLRERKRKGQKPEVSVQAVAESTKKGRTRRTRPE